MFILVSNQLYLNGFLFGGESEHHDLHHEKLNGNYATTFTIWDTLFNTKIDDEKK